MFASTLRQSCLKQRRVLSSTHVKQPCHRVFLSTTKSVKLGRRKRPGYAATAEEPNDANKKGPGMAEHDANTLSPWVPPPDSVIRKALDMIRANSNSVHYELGCGDGRVNFYAHRAPYSAQKTVGFDFDSSLIDKARHRLKSIHPIPSNIEFHCADLLKSDRLWKQMKDECTGVTMYFMGQALQLLKPHLEQAFLKREAECRIVTIGYPMDGWGPTGIENVLGTPVHLYILGANQEQLEQLPWTQTHNDNWMNKQTEKYAEFQPLEEEDEDVDADWDNVEEEKHEEELMEREEKKGEKTTR